MCKVKVYIHTSDSKIEIQKIKSKSCLARQTYYTDPKTIDCLFPRDFSASDHKSY